MAKVKTHSGTKKRFRFTGSGKLKRKKAFLRHILTKKSKKRKRALGHSTLVHPTFDAKIAQLLVR